MNIFLSSEPLALWKSQQYLRALTDHNIHIYLPGSGIYGLYISMASQMKRNKNKSYTVRLPLTLFSSSANSCIFNEENMELKVEMRGGNDQKLYRFIQFCFCCCCSVIFDKAYHHCSKSRHGIYMFVSLEFLPNPKMYDSAAASCSACFVLVIVVVCDVSRSSVNLHQSKTRTIQQ